MSTATPSANGHTQPNAADLGTSQIDMFDFSSVADADEIQIPDAVIDRAKGGVKKTEEAKPEEKVTTVATPSSKHDTKLLARAKAFGVPDGAAEAMDSVSLTELLFSIAESKTATTPKPEPTPTPAPQPPPVATETPFDWGEHAWIDPDTGSETKKKYEDADLNPALVTAIKVLSKKIAALEGVVETAKKGAIASKAKSLDERFDAEFSKFPSVLGSGAGAALVGKPELDRRKAVYDAVHRFYQALPPEARGSFPLDKAVSIQAKALFNAEPQVGVTTVVTPEEEAATKNWNKAATQTPSRRVGADGKSGRDAAIEAASQWIKENQGEGFGEETSQDEFLG